MVYGLWMRGDKVWGGPTCCTDWMFSRQLVGEERWSAEWPSDRFFLNFPLSLLEALRGLLLCCRQYPLRHPLSSTLPSYTPALRYFLFLIRSTLICVITRASSESATTPPYIHTPTPPLKCSNNKCLSSKCQVLSSSVLCVKCRVSSVANWAGKLSQSYFPRILPDPRPGEDTPLGLQRSFLSKPDPSIPHFNPLLGILNQYVYSICSCSPLECNI
jgi:hypothetical protein